MQLSTNIFTLLSLAICLFTAESVIAQSGKSLYNHAVQIPNGKYYIRNSQTGHYLTGNRNNLYPANKATAVRVQKHSGRTTILAMDSKCLSAAWSAKAKANSVGCMCLCLCYGAKILIVPFGVAAMYACRIGSSVTRHTGTLRTAKQQWILVPANSSLRRKDTIIGGEDLTERDMEAIEELIARDGASIEDTANETTVEVEVDENEEGLFGEDEDEDEDDENDMEKRASRHRSHRHRHHRHRSSRHRSSGSKSKSYGPYYVVPTDHLYDQAPRALEGRAIKSLGQNVCPIVSLKQGTKLLMWTFTAA